MDLFKSPVTLFILKALGIFILWYFVYELYLLPNGHLDEWVSLNVVAASNGIISFLGYETWTMHRILGIYGNAGIELVDGCTGISAIGLFSGFILAYPEIGKKGEFYTYWNRSYLYCKYFTNSSSCFHTT